MSAQHTPGRQVESGAQRLVPWGKSPQTLSWVNFCTSRALEEAISKHRPFSGLERAGEFGAIAKAAVSAATIGE